MPDTKPPLSYRLARALNRARYRGPAELFSLGAERARGWWASSDSLIMLVRPAGALHREAPGAEFREAGPQDALAYARDIGTDSASSFRRRLSDATHCFVVESEGRLLHASWLTTAAAWTREIGAYLAPPAGDAYIYESFTRADARGRGLYPFALAGMVTWCERTGIGRCWVAVEANNEPSKRAIAKAGFERAFTIPYARRFGRISIGEIEGPHATTGAGMVVETLSDGS